MTYMPAFLAAAVVIPSVVAIWLGARTDKKAHHLVTTTETTAHMPPRMQAIFDAQREAINTLIQAHNDTVVALRDHERATDHPALSVSDEMREVWDVLGRFTDQEEWDGSAADRLTALVTNLTTRCQDAKREADAMAWEHAEMAAACTRLENKYIAARQDTEAFMRKHEEALWQVEAMRKESDRYEAAWAKAVGDAARCRSQADVWKSRYEYLAATRSPEVSR